MPQQTALSRSYKVVILSILLGFAFIVSHSTIGQWRVDMRAPVAVTPSGAVSTVRYGATNRFGGHSRMMPSEQRYADRAPGYMASEVRYSRYAPGRLPSERGVVNTTPSSSFAFRNNSSARAYSPMAGSVRYSSRSSSATSYTTRPRPVRVNRTVAPAPTPMGSQQRRVPISSSAGQGTIRYGAARPPVTPRTTTARPSVSTTILSTFSQTTMTGSIRYHH